MTDVEVKRGIEHALKAFAGRPVGEAAIALFEALGYKSEKRLALTPNTAEQFFATFPQNRQFNAKQALVDEWRTVDFLFQLPEIGRGFQTDRLFIVDRPTVREKSIDEAHSVLPPSS